MKMRHRRHWPRRKCNPFSLAALRMRLWEDEISRNRREIEKFYRERFAKWRSSFFHGTLLASRTFSEPVTITSDDLIDEPLSITFDESTELKPFDGRVWSAKQTVANTTIAAKPIRMTVHLDPDGAVEAMKKVLERFEMEEKLREWIERNGGAKP